MGGSSPKPDANIGKAALKSAETGQAMLDWMKLQAETTNQWAAEDRSRYQSTFLPLQDKFIADATGYDTPGRRSAESAAAIADVGLQSRLAAGTRQRGAMAMGLNPMSGRFQNMEAKAGSDVALAAAGAGNLARKNVEATGRGLVANAINLGQGLAVNPGSSMQISNGAGQAGFGGAMSGYQQQGSLLNTQYQQQMQAWQANQGALGALGGAIGSLAGLFMSSKDSKTAKTPVEEGAALRAVRGLPIEQWTYKPGMGDGGTHVGPYAEDFARETGMGDGKTIDAISAIGVTIGAVKDLADKVDTLAAAMPKARGLPAADDRRRTDRGAQRPAAPVARGLPERRAA